MVEENIGGRMSPVTPAQIAEAQGLQTGPTGDPTVVSLDGLASRINSLEAQLGSLTKRLTDAGL